MRPELNKVLWLNVSSDTKITPAYSHRFARWSCHGAEPRCRLVILHGRTPDGKQSAWWLVCPRMSPCARPTRFRRNGEKETQEAETTPKIWMKPIMTGVDSQKRSRAFRNVPSHTSFVQDLKRRQTFSKVCDQQLGSKHNDLYCITSAKHQSAFLCDITMLQCCLKSQQYYHTELASFCDRFQLIGGQDQYPIIYVAAINYQCLSAICSCSLQFVECCYASL